MILITIHKGVIRKIVRPLWLLCLFLFCAFQVFSPGDTYPGHDLDSVTSLPAKDSVFFNTVYFNTIDPDSFYYESTVRSPVCNDTLCQVVLLKVYWDLKGNYIRFDTLVNHPLSKNDHKPFTSSDYRKLHLSLMDQNSVLGRKKEDELIDKIRTRYSEKLDAVTGATDLQIKNAVVEGALYSTYTLWHLVNGNIRSVLTNCTMENYNSKMEEQLIFSDDSKAIIFALGQFEDHDYIDRFQEVIRIMKKRYPLVNFYIAKNLPSEVFLSEENLKSISLVWELLDPNTRSILSVYQDFE